MSDSATAAAARKTAVGTGSESASPAEGGPSVLIAEDDRRVRASLERALRLEGYDVTAVSDGAAALKAHDTRRPDLMVLDVSMPNADGLSVCRMLRERGCDTQILMLTARHEVDDRVAGLDAGADDYLVKPFALEELLARVRARLRAGAEARQNRSHPYAHAQAHADARTHVQAHADARTHAHARDAHAGGGRRMSGRPAAGPEWADGRLRLADLEIDVDGRQAFRGRRPLHLSRTEFDLLLLLVRNSGVVLSRFDIYEEIWDGALDVESKTLDVYIGYLRRKTEIDGAPRLIHTVRGIGYVARLDP